MLQGRFDSGLRFDAMGRPPYWKQVLTRGLMIRDLDLYHRVNRSSERQSSYLTVDGRLFFCELC